MNFTIIIFNKEVGPTNELYWIFNIFKPGERYCLIDFYDFKAAIGELDYNRADDAIIAWQNCLGARHWAPTIH